jgi:hypothetical protein
VYEGATLIIPKFIQKQFTEQEIENYKNRGTKIVASSFILGLFLADPFSYHLNTYLKIIFISNWTQRKNDL